VGQAYRDEPCAFCELASREYCPRCQLAVCSEHRLTAEGYCGICAKELADDLDVSSFHVAVHDAPPDSGALFRGGFSDLLEALVRAVRAPILRRDVRLVFRTRSLAEIAAWRRQAGVTVRSSKG
jgi:hypothetical protein